MVEKINLRLHLCADTLTAVSGLINDWQQNLKPKEAKEYGHRASYCKH